MFHSRKDWENPSVTQINRSVDHSPWGAYENAEQAASCDKKASRFVQDLNGTYAFRLYPRPEEVDDFFLPEYDAVAFENIEVPGAWELQGYGLPLYSNIPYPWPLSEGEKGTLNAGKDKWVYNPPHTPFDNPTGCYRRFFTVVEEYFSRDVFVRFEGVETAFYLWINGQAVGYSEDSHLPCEFDITAFLKPGENLMAVQVMRFASCTWMEDQDHWYLSGIHQSVALIAKPRLRIEDYKFAADAMGHISADVQISRVAGFADCRVKMSVLDASGKPVGQKEGAPAVESAYAVADGSISGAVRFEMDLPEVSLWSPDSPTLYTVVFSLFAEEDDFESCRVGFRSVAVLNGIVLLNGKRLVVCGVNRHAHALTGRTISENWMREEIRQMKRMNINAVRTSHYPQPEKWYSLCNELGLLVVCECNIETHGVQGLLSMDSAYAAMFLQRAARMAQVFKNHACIYAWSLGNESGHGPNHAAMYGFLKEYDKTRLCQFESASPGPNISDVRGLMYATVETLYGMLSNPNDVRPIILVEMMYQISNSGGGAHLFRQFTDKYPRFQGGFVWDWADKVLPVADAESIPYWGYSGDFGEPIYTTPPFMVANGLVLPDLTWKPMAHEIKMAYAPLRIERRDGVGTWNTVPDLDCYVFKNQSFALKSKDFAITATLKENGIPLKTVAVDLPEVCPGNEKEFRLSIPHKKRPNCEYHVDFILRRKVSAWYDNANDILFACQYPLESGALLLSPEAERTPISIAEDGKLLKIAGSGFMAVFNRKCGRLEGLYQGETSFLSGGEPCFSRPYTGLDCEKQWGWYHETAPLAELKAELISESLTFSNEEAVLRFDFAFAAQHLLTARVIYRITAQGIEVSYSGTAKGGWQALPRAGISFTLPKRLDNLTYFGLGPAECYSDRRMAARLGVYETTVEETHFPFIPPSETGGHEETRWLSLLDASGNGIRITGETPFHFDAHHNTVADYRAARHEHELKRREVVFLHLDAAHSPIGGHMAWSTDTDSNAMLSDGIYSQRFIFKVIGSGLE